MSGQIVLSFNQLIFCHRVIRYLFGKNSAKMAFPLSRFRNDPKMHNAITESMLIIIHRLIRYFMDSGLVCGAQSRPPRYWYNAINWLVRRIQIKIISICTFCGSGCCQKWIIRCNAATVSRRNFYRIIIFEFAFTQNVDCHSICLAMVVRGRAKHIYIHAIDASILKHGPTQCTCREASWHNTHPTHAKES